MVGVTGLRMMVEVVGLVHLGVMTDLLVALGGGEEPSALVVRGRWQDEFRRVPEGMMPSAVSAYRMTSAKTGAAT